MLTLSLVRPESPVRRAAQGNNDGLATVH
jgi:hypothetical protein